MHFPKVKISRSKGILQYNRKTKPEPSGSGSGLERRSSDVSAL